MPSPLPFNPISPKPPSDSPKLNAPTPTPSKRTFERAKLVAFATKVLKLAERNQFAAALVVNLATEIVDFFNQQ